MIIDSVPSPILCSRFFSETLLNDNEKLIRSCLSMAPPVQKLLSAASKMLWQSRRNRSQCSLASLLPHNWLLLHIFPNIHSQHFVSIIFSFSITSSSFFKTNNWMGGNTCKWKVAIREKLFQLFVYIQLKLCLAAKCPYFYLIPLLH